MSRGNGLRNITRKWVEHGNAFFYPHRASFYLVLPERFAFCRAAQGCHGGPHTCTVACMVAFTWLLWTSLTRTVIDIKYMEAIIFLSPAVLFLLVVVISLGSNSEESNTD